jgi:glutathione S-transferase
MDGVPNMKLYVTYGSPYARLARIMVIEKVLEDRVEIIEAKTRTPGSPYYQINPSGRVPYLVDDTGVGMEDSQLICAYLDGLDGKPSFHSAAHASDVTDALMQGPPRMAHLILAVAVEMARKRGLGDLTAGRRRLASWMRSISDLPSMQRTVPP